MIHRQLTVYGSWVTSVGRTAELLELMARWDLHPDRTVTHTFALDDAAEAYAVADDGRSGKVAIVI
jgi:threonine dehydrogenase-like Zn-dependent dehydrogenase